MKFNTKHRLMQLGTNNEKFLLNVNFCLAGCLYCWATVLCVKLFRSPLRLKMKQYSLQVLSQWEPPKYLRQINAIGSSATINQYHPFEVRLAALVYTFNIWLKKWLCFFFVCFCYKIYVVKWPLGRKQKYLHYKGSFAYSEIGTD